MANQNYSFWRGLCEVPPVKRPEVEARIMAELGIKRDAYIVRRRGKVEPSMSEGKIIEGVFADFNVPADRVWGLKPVINQAHV